MRNLFLSLIAFVIVLTACDSQPKESTKDEQSTSEVITETDSKRVVKASTVSKEQLEGVLNSYFSIKNALVKTNMSEAKTALNSFMNTLDKEMNQLKTIAVKMQSSEDVEELRAGFEGLSQQVYAIVKENEDNKEGVVYKQFCPMAFKNKGAYWLSQEKEIKNPYFGDKMLKCGKVQEEI